ncbi:hypothetical protein M405DRAFT_209370 [Rhizopogon salebrosus TDB-379]|nr:hypothetical protein M405DRAFT_209370 [Rhizopogon salebrosus TDB-379]
MIIRPKFVGPKISRHFRVRAITVQNVRKSFHDPSHQCESRTKWNSIFYQHQRYITQLSLWSLQCTMWIRNTLATKYFRTSYIIRITHPTPINSCLHPRKGLQGDLFCSPKVGP